MGRTIFSLLMGGLVVANALAADGPTTDPPAWPQANGPFGNLNPRRYGVKLLDDLGLARLAWVSEYRDLGFAKGPASGFAGHLALTDTHPGSASGLIVAEGKVFASSYQPRGGAWAEKDFRIAPIVARLSPEQLAALKRNASFDADDLAVALDAATGKTVWEAVEEGKGLNRYSGKGATSTSPRRTSRAGPSVWARADTCIATRPPPGGNCGRTTRAVS
jgi:hypothetical protein